MAHALDRRAFLATTAAAAFALPAVAQASEDARLRTLLDAIFEENLAESPQGVTRLGLDKGARAAAKSQLDSQSIAALDRQRARTKANLARLETIDRARLSPTAMADYDAVAFTATTDTEAGDRFAWGDYGGQHPYVISQLSGAYQSIPDFLGSQHGVETRADAEAYLARLEAFATVMDEEAARVRRDVGLGVRPPDFVVERTLIQMRGLKTAPEASPLVTSLADRAREKGIAGDWSGEARKIYVDKVAPALDRQIALIESLKPGAVHDAGCWRLPDGEAFYVHALKNHTTTNLTAEEVHQLGLDTARELSARADVLLKGQGYSKGAVGERIDALFKDTRYHYADTDADKERLIADLNVLVREIQPRLPTMFGTLPKAPVEIRRVPKFIEAGAPGGYYNRPALDGSRPGIYWINLRLASENPSWTLKTLTYHEAIPGHHLQRTLQQEADLPMIRRTAGFAAFAEGWALYTEQVAKEMGVYDDDPLGEIGYLQAALFRAARLVVDTGLHARRWSREKAIAVMTAIDGSPPSAAATEIERYSVRPGQACSYMVGKLTWLRLRGKAQDALVENFDFRRFHDAVLLAGAMPLTVLEGVVDRYIAASKG